MQSHHKRQLTSQDYKILALSSLGGALEFYDFIIFIFFSTIISQLFFPESMPGWLSQVQTFGLFAAGYLARPFGGLIMAHFGDLFGRKRMFTFSILLMSIPTLCIGFLPTYEQIDIGAPLLLLLMRICQGAAVGGEIPGAWVFVSEHSPKRYVGLANGILTAGLVTGILIGALVSTAINVYVKPQAMMTWGWRLPFILGGLFGILSMYLRRWLKETPIFTELQQRKQLEKDLPIKRVWMQHKRVVFISMLLTWVLSAGIMIVILMAPSYLQQYHGISPVVALQANSIAIICLAFSCILSGTLCDRFGVAKVIVVGCLCCIGTTWLFYHSLGGPRELLFISYALAGLGVGVVGSFSFFMVNAFPVNVRYTGISFSFNISYAIAGGLTPLMISLLTDFNDKLAPAYYVMLLFTLGAGIGFYLLVQKKNDNNRNDVEHPL